MGKALISIVATASLALMACSGDDDTGNDGSSVAETEAGPDTEAETEAETESESVAPAETEAAESAETEAAESDDEAESDGETAAGGASAELELANGESYEFSILCVLEPQEAAGSEILYTVVSSDDPSLDVTQFGDEGTVTDLAVVTVYDGDFESLWEAGSMYEAFGGSLDLTLEGSTVRASGSFYPAADPAAEPVQGDLVANC